METQIESENKSKDVEKPFKPIEIFRIEAKTLIEKCNQKVKPNSVLNRLIDILSLAETQQTLYFHFSPNLFIANYEDRNASQIHGTFKPEDKPKFLQFLEQYNQNIVTISMRAYYKGKSRSMIVIEDSKDNIRFFEYDPYNADSLNTKYLYALEILIRMFGEKIDRGYGYDPLAEITLLGLCGENSQWASFLMKDLYDPRLLMLIQHFAFGYTQEEIDNADWQFGPRFYDTISPSYSIRPYEWWISKRSFLSD